MNRLTSFLPLQLTDKQVLVDGVHETSLDSLHELFGRFQKTDRRSKLYKKLSEYVDELRKAGISGSIIVDGSFIMKCIDEPDDIDVILVLKDDWDMTQDLLPYQYNLVSKKRVKRNFPFDLLTVQGGSEAEAKWIAYFSQVNIKWYEPYGFPNGATKGLVRIAL